MLLRPDAYSRMQRSQMARDVSLLLEGSLELEEVVLRTDDSPEREFEPGCLEDVEDPW